MSTRDLDKAKKNKADEFYTQMPDIEAELRHYKEHFHGKVVLCNCDDPYESNFFKYFAMNFNYLGLKKLIATSYSESPVAYGQLPLFEIQTLKARPSSEKPACRIEITEVPDLNQDGAVDLTDVEYLLKNHKNVFSFLEGDGDFRSQECVELLQEADIVVTNPPFSLFREYVAQLVEYDKKFIIIGNTNALTYKEIFRMFKDDSIRTGYTNFNVGMHFYVPDSWENYHRLEDGRKVVRVSTSCWYTNLEVQKHKEYITLYKKYTPEEYPHYDNYDAINVDKVAEIPRDFDGLMGVPITFLDKYNPDQFEILGITDRQNTSGLRTKKYTVDDSPKYNDLNARCVLKVNNDYQALYARILVKRKGAAQ